MRRSRRIGEVLTTLAFLALAGLVFSQTHTSFVEQGGASGGALQNAAMFPELLAYGLVALAALQLVRLLRSPAAGGGADTPDELQVNDGAVASAGDRSLLARALITTAALVLYLFALKPLGYHLATPIFMLVSYRTLGVKLLPAAILGLVTSLAMSLLFEWGMNVILPVGRYGIGF